MNHRTAIHEDRDRTVVYLPNEFDAARGALDDECPDGIKANGEAYRDMTLVEWAVALAVIGISVWSFAGLLVWR